MSVRLKEFYDNKIVPALMERFGFKNRMQVPRIEKIVLNMGVGEAIGNSKALEKAVADMTIISGQKPILRKSKKSVSNFKLRKGMNIGCKVTLRGDRMYEFLDRLLTFTMPRIRDFRGVSSGSLDGRGNYSIGILEQIIFPEIDYDKIDKIRGMDITIVTTARIDEEAFELLREFKMPFRA